MKLTDEQVEKAAEALWYISPSTVPFNNAAKIATDGCRSAARTIAPFVQIPWDEPTREELNDCIHAIIIRGGYNTATGIEILREFVAMRNRANSPVKEPPVDPRVTMLVDFFSKNHLYKMTIPEFAKEILELLDRKE